MRILLSCLLALLYVDVCFAQGPSQQSQRGQNSLFANYFSNISALGGESYQIKGNIWGVTAGYNFSMEKNKAYWTRALNAKNVAVAFSYINMEDAGPAQTSQAKGFLGDAYSLRSQLDICLFNIDKTNFMLSPGFGLTYVTKTFRTTDNPLVGSHINMNVILGAKLEIPVVCSTKIVAGIDLFHFSNTAFKLPNKGVNLLNASLGIVEGLNSVNKERKVSFAATEDKGAFEFGIGMGHRGLQQQFNAPATSLNDSLQRKFGTSKLNNIGISAGYNYRLNPLISFKAASDVIYYTTTYYLPDYKTTVQEYGTSKDKLSVGLSGGLDVWLNRLVFEGSYGYYLHLNYATTPIHTYWIIGAKYYFTPWLAFEAKTYLHLAEAHYTNFGVLFHLK